MAESAPPPHLKGGGAGGPQRWTGKGPRPARHIPWPELFKHHESNLKGHLKMMDMVRKHCVEGSGNWKMASECVDRTHRMLREFKQNTYNFVPPADNIDRVPLGASSASMYPGYSPADHIYGEASQEYGQRYSEMKKQGTEFKQGPDGIEYVVGQSSKDGKEQLAELRRNREQESQPTVSDAVDGDEDPSTLFTFDSNPTPVDQLKAAPATSKSQDEQSTQKASAGSNSLLEARLARIKSANDKKHQDKEVDYLPLSQPQTNGNDEFEKAVAERKAKKDEKRKQKNAESSREKDGKKRKRQSDSSQIASAPAEATTNGASTSDTAPATTEPLAERPKKKKQKSSHKDEIVLPVVEAAPAGKEAAPVTLLQETSVEKKKHKKRSAEDDVNGAKETQAEERDQRQKKRRKASD